MENPFIYMAKQAPANRTERLTAAVVQALFALTILAFIVGAVLQWEVAIFTAFGAVFLQAVIQGWYPQSMRAEGLYNDSDEAHLQNSKTNAGLWKIVVIMSTLCALGAWYCA